MSSNLWSDLPAALPVELTQTLLAADQLRIERIISRGHASAPGFWYDQAEHEWVVLLEGAARLAVIDQNGAERMIELSRGDYLHLPAHQRHRVEWTDPQALTIWLAVFYGSEIE
jgi:cupin 2 domain-containing protein